MVSESLGHAEVQCQIWSRPPAILEVEPHIFSARIENLLAGLDELVGSANQEIREVDARLASVKDKLSVLGVKVPLVDLVIVKLTSKFKAVRSDHLVEIIQPL